MKNVFYSILSLIILSSCATINSKSVYPVTIKSNEPVKVTVYNKKNIKIAETKTLAQENSFQLKSSAGYFQKAKYHLRVEKNGFMTQYFTVDSQIDDFYWGKWSDGAMGLELFYMASGGLLYGMLITDPITGAMYEFKKTNYNVDLKPYVKTILDKNELIEKYNKLNN